MSYLDLASIDLADFQQGVISLWFRFSQDSVDKATEYRSTKVHPEAPDILDRTIPLVTFGRKVTAKVYDSKTKTFTQEIPNSTAPPLTATVVQVDEVKGEFFCAPSHIGIIMLQGSDENEPPTPQLVMKFQTETRAQVQGLNGQTTDVTWTLEPFGDNYEMHSTIEDVSYIQVGEPESFLIVPTFKVDVDQWHHLLVSFDFTTKVDVVAIEGTAATEDDLRGRTIKSFCKVWYAFDDENKSGKENIGNNTDAHFRPSAGWVPADANGIIPQNAEAAIFTYTKVPPALDSAGNPLDKSTLAASPEYHWQASPLVTQGGPMGFPASEQYVETIYHCEMAEFQLFTGVTMDTSVEENRRAFIDAEGKPVSPSKSSESDGLPGSIDLLGQRPDVLLTKSNNWKNGKNTGATGTDDDGQEIPEGQFVPTALIATYKPDPSLGN